MTALLEQLFEMIDRAGVMTGQDRIGLGLSGGPDSMALGYCLSHLAQRHYPHIMLHAITVDHALRDESAAEAKTVGDWVQDWPNTVHQIMRWDEDKPESRILESARTARYHLLRDYMRENDINHLFLAHHRDDQAETFLFRLAKGSGLDGLSGMREVQALDDEGRVMIRPFLGVDKASLVALCEAYRIPFVRDPTNEKQDYARPRLRAARTVLEDEGLTSKRLAVTAMRLARARDALEYYTQKLFDESVMESTDQHCVFRAKEILEAPEELMIRLLQEAMGRISPERDYAPRLEKLEEIVKDMRRRQTRRATLGGCLLTHDEKQGVIRVEREAI